MAFWEVAWYMDNVSAGIGLANVERFWRPIFRCSSTFSSSFVHLKMHWLTHPFNVWNSGMAFLADLEMKHLNAVSFPFRPCISFKLRGGVVSNKSLILDELGCIPFFLM